MAFDGITISHIVHELNSTLLDGRIHKIAQPEEDELLLTIKTKDGQKKLYISASASLPLIYLTESNKPSPMTAPNFCMLLRKHIGNGRITAITQPNFERIIQFEIEHFDELGDLCKKFLIVEIMGKHSNIIFCNDACRIIDSIKHVSAQMSSVREVLPGREYFIPDTMEKLNPLEVPFSAFDSAMAEKPCGIAKAIYTTFTGVSPIVAEEICAITGIDSNASFKELDDMLKIHLYKQFAIFFRQVLHKEYVPQIYYNGMEPKEFSSLPLSHLSSYDSKRFDSISFLLETYYASKNTVTRMRQKSVDLRKIVQTTLERARKKYALQYKQLQDTIDRDKYRVYGELINVYGYGLDADAKVLTCENYYTNEEVTIPLDSTKTPQENAQKYFDKYNKMKRTHEALTELIQETKDDITYLESVATALDIATSEDDLNQIKEELITAGYMRRKFTKQKVKITSKPLHYLSSDGYHIYVGKNNLQNEELTFRFANGNDWWFHAKGCPGSHVIVKSNGEELPDRTFEEAGRLAAYYSSQRGAEKVEIDYIEKKHIKKPNGGKPGFVVYYTNYSLMIDSDIRSIECIEG